MEKDKQSPFSPADQVPLHRVAPLAPSQEMAYRQKCIALKRRLSEIEANNDAICRRIETEKQFHNKMRLNRAILLNHLKEMMETPSQKLPQPQLDKLASGAGGDSRVAEKSGPAKRKPVKDYLLDDSSDESEGDEIPEPQERPTRFKRGNNPPSRDAAPANNLPASVPVTAANLYQQNTLPNLAPAGSFSPGSLREPAMLTSSFRVASTPAALQAPAQPPYPVQHQQAPVLTNSYPPQSQQSTPLPSIPHAYSQPTDSPAQPLYQSPYAPPPVRPAPPFDQFTEHMRPQLEQDSYPADQIATRIKEEWAMLSHENRQLWDQRYNEQMQEYEALMDAYKRDQRGSSGGRAPVINGVGVPPTGFSSVNR